MPNEDCAMNRSIEALVTEHEEQLKQAMLKSDIKALDKLLSSELIFTNHLGQRMTKQDDLEAHRSGMLKIEEITLSEPQLRITDDTAIVSVQAHIAGVFAGTPSESVLRFTRVWKITSNQVCQVIAAHSSSVA